MANVNSLTTSGSNASSLYGTRNVLSGLASGLDTEALIENSVSAYKTKITQLQQQQTKYEWKQEAYQSITDKLDALTQTYTSYTSKTNLSSNSFFSKAMTTTAVGPTNAVSQVSATGRSSSDIQILAAQSATAYSYSVDAKSLGFAAQGTSTDDITRSGASIAVGTLKGSMTIAYDNQTIEITFDENDTGINAAGGTSLVDAIRKKLSETTVETSKNGAMTASDVINVSVENGKIVFSENTAKNNQGAKPYVSRMDSKLSSALGAVKEELYTGSSKKQYTLSNVTTSFSENKSVKDYLEGRTINVVVDGANKSFQLEGLQVGNDGKIKMDSLQKAFQDGLNSVGARVEVGIDGNKLTFSIDENSSSISISAKDSKANELLGLGSGVGNSLNVDASLSNLLGSSFQFNPEKAATKADGVSVERIGSSNIYKDSDGNRYELAGGTYYRVNEKDERLFELTINNKSVYVSQEASLDSVLNAINDSDMGVTAAYSKLTGRLTLTAKETGSTGSISFDNSLAKSLFTPTSTDDLTLGDVFGEDSDWFDPVTGKVTLYASSNITSSTSAKGTYDKDTKLSDFLKDFNVSSSSVQFMDSSSNGSGHAKSDYLSGYDLTLEKVSTSGNPANIKLANSKNGSGETMKLTDFVDLVHQAVESRNAGSVTVKEGLDAQVRAMVNGETVNLTRSSNTIDMDGMSVTIKGDFGERDANGAILTGEASATEKANAVSFTSSGGSEDVIKTIREFVEQYNASIKEVYEAFSTQPAEKNSKTHTKYEPLTEDDKSSMSDKAVESYEAKAKQGLLFGDSDLRGLYQQMANAISPGGSDGAVLRSIGIETTYSNGFTQIKLDESKLRSALEEDPDKVRNAFTKSKDAGSSSEGLMSSIKKTLSQYASSSIASPGILVKKSGSTLKSQIENVQSQIESWQSKMGSKVDYYTRQFTSLEKLINKMNSQSSAFSGLTGGY